MSEMKELKPVDAILRDWESGEIDAAGTIEDLVAIIDNTRTLSISDQEVEKVARAICGAECVGNQKPHDLMGVLFTPAGTEGTRPYRWETKIRAARAAILAIRQENF